MDFLKQVKEQLLSIWKRLEKRQKIFLISSTAIFLVSLIILINWASHPEYSLLYSNLALQDAGEIANKLKEKKITYKIENGGKAILVPSSDVYEIRLQLAMEGVPKSGQIGFEIFDNTNIIGMTNFMEKVNYQRALQGELSRTIQSLNEISQARVHLVLPESSSFIEKKKLARASVMIKLKPGKWLAKKQVIGIANLIASSVEDLTTKNITIIDEKGNMLLGGEENDETTYLSGNQIELKRDVEQYLTNKIQLLLIPVLGIGKSAVTVDAKLNFDQIRKTEERYDPEGKVVKNEVRSETTREGGGGVIGGSPGVKTNLGQNSLLSQGLNPEKETKEESNIQYAINKTIEDTIGEVGNIEKLSIAVAVDGTYKTGPDGKNEYIPRSKEEIDKLVSIIKGAIGYNSSRGDTIAVTNVPFISSLPGAEEKGLLGKIIGPEFLRSLPKYIIIGILILMLFLLLRPIIKAVSSFKISPMEEKVPSRVKPEQVIKREEEIIPFKEGQLPGKELLYKKEIFKAVEEKPEDIAQIIRVWLTNHKGKKK